MMENLALFTAISLLPATCTVSSVNDDFGLYGDETQKIKQPEGTKNEYQYTEEGYIEPEQAEMIIKEKNFYISEGFIN